MVLLSTSKNTICTYCRFDSNNHIFADTFRSQWPTDYNKLEIYCGTVFVQRECDECMFTCNTMDRKKVRTWANPSCSGSLSDGDGDSLGTRVENNTSSEREVKLTSEWLKEMWIVQIPFADAAAFASPCNVTSGTPSSFGRISISFIAAPAPLDEMPRDLNTASLPTQRAANDARKDG